MTGTSSETHTRQRSSLIVLAGFLIGWVLYVIVEAARGQLGTDVAGITLALVVGLWAATRRYH